MDLVSEINVYILYMANERYIPGKYFIGYKLGFHSNTETK